MFGRIDRHLVLLSAVFLRSATYTYKIVPKRTYVFYQDKSRAQTLLVTAAKIIHTYIIGHYIPTVRIIELVYHITYVVCVNFVHNCRSQLKVESELQIF